MTLTPVRTPAESRLRRMEALATLPVFVTLAGQRVVVAGGSEAAAWKAELAAAAGAQVDVFAAAPSGELVDLGVPRGSAGARATLDLMTQLLDQNLALWHVGTDKASLETLRRMEPAAIAIGGGQMPEVIVAPANQ